MNTTAWIPTQTLTQPDTHTWPLPAFSCDWVCEPSPLEKAAEHFDTITLEEMDAVALLNRTDTKFLMSAGQMLSLLPTLRSDYFMLSLPGHRLNRYRTLYFDTPAFDLYNLHVNGHGERCKVRSREYVDSNQSFLEVKHKTRKDRTIKVRVQTAQPMVAMNPQTVHWLQDIFPYNPRELEPKLMNTFTRITLVNHAACERVTLDVDIAFYTTAASVRLEGIAIAEVKRDALNCKSSFLEQMRVQRIHPYGFSKYCAGVAMLYEQVKKNYMKPRLLRIGKIMRGTHLYE
jgi:hypothetical protein